MPGFNIGGGSGPTANVEFHRNHRWRIEDLGIPKSGGPTKNTGPGSNSSTSNSDGSARTRGNVNPPSSTGLQLYAQSIQIPSLEFDEETIPSASMEYKVIKRAKWKPVTVKFYDVFGLYKLFREWQKLMWDERTGIQGAVDYKGEPKFVLTDGEGKDKQIYTLKGAYPKLIDHGELSYTNSDVKLLTVTYSYDFARIEFK